MECVPKVFVGAEEQGHSGLASDERVIVPMPTILSGTLPVLPTAARQAERRKLWYHRRARTGNVGQHQCEAPQLPDIREKRWGRAALARAKGTSNHVSAFPEKAGYFNILKPWV